MNGQPRYLYHRGTTEGYELRRQARWWGRQWAVGLAAGRVVTSVGMLVLAAVLLLR